MNINTVSKTLPLRRAQEEDEANPNVKEDQKRAGWEIPVRSYKDLFAEMNKARNTCGTVYPKHLTQGK